MYIVINELERDLLSEIINIGLARAADSFAKYAKDHVLLDVPDVKIIEPYVLPEIIHNFKAEYRVTRTELTGDLEGKTFLLFDNQNLNHIAQACLRHKTPADNDYESCLRQTVEEISETITDALANQLSAILNLDVESGETAALFNYETRSIKAIMEDLSASQPFIITIKTQFRNLRKTVEFPMIVILYSDSLFKILQFIRKNNLYEYKVLRM